MKVFRALLRVHAQGRGPLLAGCLLLGLLPFALPLLPNSAGQTPAELRAAAAPLLGGLTLLLLALFLGSELLARDFAERRLAFFLARPISTAAIFWSRFAALVSTLAAGALLLLVPVALAGDLELPADGIAPWILLAFLGGCVLLPLVASAAAIALRSRSPLAAVDLAVLAGGGAAAALAAQSLHRAGAAGPLFAGLAGFGIATGAALAAGHVVALDRGRTDLGAARAALARAVWATLPAAALIFGVFAAWTLTPTPADLASILGARTSPSGEWLAVAGPLRGRLGFTEEFLWHPASGRSLRIGSGAPANWFTSHLEFAADADVAVWLQPAGSEWAVWSLDLGQAASGQITPRRTPISFASPPSLLTPSPTGTRLAAQSRDRLQLFDLATGRLLDTADEPGFVAGARWLDDGHLRIFALRDLGGDVATAVAWDLDARTATGGGAPARHATLVLSRALRGGADLRASPDGRRVLLRDAQGWRLVGVTPGELPSDVAVAPGHALVGDARSRPLFLPDGRILLRRHTGDAEEITLLDRGGALERRIPMSLGTGGEPRPRVFAIGMPDAQHLWLLVAPRVGGEPARLVALDLGTGNAVELGRDLVPADLRGLDGLEMPLVAGPAARWLLDRDERLHYLRPDGVLAPAGGGPADGARRSTP